MPWANPVPHIQLGNHVPKAKWFRPPAKQHKYILTKQNPYTIVSEGMLSFHKVQRALGSRETIRAA